MPTTRTPLPADARRLIGKYVTVGTFDRLVWRLSHYNSRTNIIKAVSLSDPPKTCVLDFDDLRRGYDEGLVNFGREPRRENRWRSK